MNQDILLIIMGYLTLNKRPLWSTAQAVLHFSAPGMGDGLRVKVSCREDCINC
jgi:hypothetical protein